jgi:hypothetical protein
MLSPSDISSLSALRSKTPIRLDIGAGVHPMKGWTAMDRVAMPGIHIVHDFLDFPWPFEDGSVSEARAEHVIEHIPHLCLCCRKRQDPFFAFFDEVWRVLRPGGKLYLISPHSDSRRAWGDPTHCRAINEQTLMYLSNDVRHSRGVGHYQVHCNFDAQYDFVIDERGKIQDLRATLVKLV